MTADGTAAPTSSRRLIEAATELVLEHHDTGAGLRDVFAHLTPGAVAERAGLSRALIYHHWGDPEVDGSESFDRFLSAVARRLWSESLVPDELAAAASELPDNLSDLIVILSEYEHDRSVGTGRALWRASQSMTLHGAVPADGGTEMIGRLADLYQVLLERFDRETVPPLVPFDLALTLGSVVEGFSLQRNVLTDRIDERHAWSRRCRRS